jgi:hypothetical protein
MNVVDMYSMRSCEKLVLSQLILDNVSKLRRTAMVFRPVYKASRHHKPRQADNWREKLLVDIVRKVKEREDPEYSEVFSIFNKIAKSNMEKMSENVITLIQKRDETFRLRVVTLLFDRAITNHAYANVMADCSMVLSKSIPEILEDLVIQVGMFETLYDMNTTIAYSDNTIVEWTKQKEKRRGYAKFVSELFIRGLITEELLQNGLIEVVKELQALINSAKSEQADENIHQCVVFLYETAKLLKRSDFLKQNICEILKSKLPMKTKFKLEDALKLLS